MRIFWCFYRYAKNRISCLSLIGNNQIWAGSFDSVIYVINTETRRSEQQLRNHTNFVSDIISQKKSGKCILFIEKIKFKVLLFFSKPGIFVCDFSLVFFVYFRFENCGLEFKL